MNTRRLAINGMCFDVFGVELSFSVVGTEEDYDSLLCLAKKTGEVPLQAGMAGMDVQNITGPIVVVDVSKKHTKYQGRKFEITVSGILRLE
jgi:hypothetical protein